MMDKKIEKTIENLKRNNIEAFYAETSADAVTLVEEMLSEGETISCGGSVTLAESGVFALMQSGKYNFLDRSLAKSPQETAEIYRKTFYADTFLTSANAITENGELINVDGNCNRIAAITFGPKRVIVIVGKNKLVGDVNEGFYRVKTVAAPKNAQRLGLSTPCAKLGHCIKKDEAPSAGCDSEQRICVNYVISGRQRVADRVKVIIVNENLGY
jgi:L-lactate utilization protein LutB